MKDWEKSYKEKLCSPGDAVKHIKSGDHVVIGNMAGAPDALIDAMVKNASAYKNVTIHHMDTLGSAEYAAEKYKENFYFDGWYLSPGTREAVADGRADITMVHYYQIPEFLESGLIKDDVALVMVSKPDPHGYVSLGVASDYTMAAVKSAATVIAQVNSRMPFTYGDTLVHVSKLDHIVEADQELCEAEKYEFTDAEKKVAKNCADIIPDGATIDLGTGRIAAAVAAALKGKKDLTVFSQVLTDEIVDLYETGVATGVNSQDGDGTMVVSYAAGTRRTYDFIDKNPAVKICQADYVNQPYEIAKRPLMRTVGSVLQMDITGQSLVGSIGDYQYSGIGGHAGQLRGVDLCRDRLARAIIAMTSTYIDENGKKASRILPLIAQGADIGIPAEEMEYVVTEYGVAYLKGQSSENRSRALIEIADPEFRQELIESYETRYKKPY